MRLLSISLLFLATSLSGCSFISYHFLRNASARPQLMSFTRSQPGTAPLVFAGHTYDSVPRRGIIARKKLNRLFTSTALNDSAGMLLVPRYTILLIDSSGASRASSHFRTLRIGDTRLTDSAGHYVENEGVRTTIFPSTYTFTAR